MRKLKLFFINGLILTATSVLLRVADVSLNVFISGKIGAEGMGIFTLISSVYIFAITLAMSGIGLTTTRLVAEELSCGHEAGVKKSVFKCLLYAIFFGLLSSFLLFITAPYISVYLLRNDITLIPLRILSVCLPFMSVSSVINGYFIAVRRVVKSASAQIVERAVQITLCVYLLTFIVPKGIGYACIAIVFAGLISEVSSTLLLASLYHFDKRKYRNMSYSKEIRKRMFHIAIPVALSSYLRSGLSTIKHLMIPIGLEKSGENRKIALAQYGVIQGMVMPVIYFPSALIGAFTSLTVPEIAGLNVRKDYKSINRAISKIFRVTLLFSICTSGILISYSKELAIAIYNNVSVGYFIKALAPLVVIMYFDEVVDGLLKGVDRQVKVVQINIIDTAMCIALIYFLLPIFGAKGYIAVVYASELLNGYLSIMQLFKTTSFEIKFIDWIIKPAIAIIISCIVSVRIVSKSFILNIVITLIIYIILVILFSIKTFLVSKFKRTELKLSKTGVILEKKC